MTLLYGVLTQAIAWKWYLTVAIVVILAGLLAGCTTMAGIGAAGTVVDPTPEEQAFIEDLRAKAQRVGEAGQVPGCKPNALFGTCAPHVVVLDGFTKLERFGYAPLGKGTVAIYRETLAGRHFHISRVVIQAAMTGHPAALATLAHEIVHWVHQDVTRIQLKRVSPEQAELEANARAPWVLQVGWGMAPQEAVRAMWGMLVHEAQTGRPARGAHLSGCAELRDFERRAGLVPYGVEGCAS